MLALALPKVNSNAALVSKRLLNAQSALRQKRVDDISHLSGGNGTEVITHPINAAGITPSPPTKSLGFRGFDSSKLLILRDGNFHVRINQTFRNCTPGLRNHYVCHSVDTGI